MRRALALLRLAAAAGASFGLVPATAEIACPTESQGFKRLATDGTEIAYRWEPAELKVGQFFAAEVVACRVPGPGDVPLWLIGLDATMPAHGHGMSYRPEAKRMGEGRWRFTGLMLHMPGTWQIAFDLYLGRKRIRLTHEVKLSR
jgi:hypothetical protein